MSEDRNDLDLLLINPGEQTATYQSLGRELAAIEPPIWAGLMAEFARRKGHSAAILDARAEGLDAESSAERALAMRPQLVTVTVYGHNPSASTQVMPAAGALCRALKARDPKLPVLLVGGHVAALPERTLREEAADFTCAGEGPWTLHDLLQALKAGTRDLSGVRDLVYREGDSIRIAARAPLVQDLDAEMPGIAWDLLPMDKYRAHNWHCFGGLKRQPYAAIYTSLGCPFHCSFCCIQAPFLGGERVLGLKSGTHSYRLWSPAAVLAQLDLLVTRYGVRNVKFADEIFVLNREHVAGICRGIIERGYDLNIWAYARMDTLKPDIAELLAKAGIRWLALGIESASERVRDDIHKGYRPENLRKTVAMARASGINIAANYIFGLPEDDLATMQQTLDLALDLNCEYANFYCAMAYPGSELYQTALREGWPLPKSWSGYSQYAADALPLPTRHISGAEVLRFRDAAFQTYFSHPPYLAMIGRKFGPGTVEHLRAMAAQKLVREAAPETERHGR
jgi:radical SAM superfamily enzyme YgiQ (UPF0313 family)